MSKVKGAPLVSVIIINYNGGNVLVECLESVFNQRHKAFEVILVDNASEDGSADRAAKKFPIILMENKKNLGYSIAGNRGVKLARGKYCFLLNNDIKLHHNCIGELVKEAERNPSMGLFQSKILFKSDEKLLNSAGNMIHFTGFGLCRGIGEKDKGQYDGSRWIGYASGATIFIRKEVIDEIGFFDPTYFIYNEDTDLGWRSMLFGWKSCFVPSAICYHELGYSWGQELNPLKFYFLERNRLITIIKNYSSNFLFYSLPIILIVEISVLAYAALKGLLYQKIKGYSDVIKLRKKISESRGVIQGHRIVGDRDILRFMEIKLKHIYLPETVKVLNRILSLFWNVFVKRLI